MNKTGKRNLHEKKTYIQTELIFHNKVLFMSNLLLSCCRYEEYKGFVFFFLLLQSLHTIFVRNYGNALLLLDSFDFALQNPGHGQHHLKAGNSAIITSIDDTALEMCRNIIFIIQHLVRAK